MCLPKICGSSSLVMQGPIGSLLANCSDPNKLCVVVFFVCLFFLNFLSTVLFTSLWHFALGVIGYFIHLKPRGKIPLPAREPDS